MKAGDVLVLPAGTGHRLSRVQPRLSGRRRPIRRSRNAEPARTAVTSARLGRTGSGLPAPRGAPRSGKPVLAIDPHSRAFASPVSDLIELNIGFQEFHLATVQTSHPDVGPDARRMDRHDDRARPISPTPSIRDDRFRRRWRPAPSPSPRQHRPGAEPGRHQPGIDQYHAPAGRRRRR